nr:Unknown Function [uncultured bacterium]
MTDSILYFAHKAISLNDIENTLRDLGYTILHESSSDPVAIFSGPSGCWWIYEADEEIFDSEVSGTMAEYGAEAYFDIELLLKHLPHVREVLRALILNYGGWAGAPTNDLRPVYTLDNIDSLPLYVSDG